MYDALLDPTGEAAGTPEKAAALAAALKRQSRYGAIGQLMGVQPTQQVGAQMQEEAQFGLRQAMLQRQEARQLAAEQARQSVLDSRDMRNFDQRERGIEATRINQATTRAASGPIIDTPTGKARVTPDNTVTPIMDAGGAQVQPLPKPPTESQSTLATYGRRVELALPIMDKMLDAGYLPSGKDFAVVSMGVNPLVEAVALSDEGKTYYGVASQIINAIMRRESGAAISAGEWVNANKRWLPQPDDPPNVIANKRAALQGELATLKEQAGGAWKDRPEPAAEPAAEKPPAEPRTKTVGGVTYYEQNGEWFAR
jgi:hypothetical protein